MTPSLEIAAALPHELASRDQRSRLLAGSLEAVTAHGYPATTVAQITKSARVSRATFYECFANKDDCVLATYDLIVDWLAGRIAAALAGVESWVEAVGIAVEATLASLALDPRLTPFCVVEILHLDRLGPARHENTVERLAVPLRAGRARCPWGTRLSLTLEQALVGGAIWLVGYRRRRDPSADLTALAPDLTYFLLTPYVGSSQARQAAAGNVAG